MRKRAKEVEEVRPIPRVRIPRPVPGGTTNTQSMGKFLDRLLGVERDHRKTMEELEPYFEPLEEAEARWREHGIIS